MLGLRLSGTQTLSTHQAAGDSGDQLTRQSEVGHLHQLSSFVEIGNRMSCCVGNTCGPRCGRGATELGMVWGRQY